MHALEWSCSNVHRRFSSSHWSHLLMNMLDISIRFGNNLKSLILQAQYVRYSSFSILMSSQLSKKQLLAAIAHLPTEVLHRNCLGVTRYMAAMMDCRDIANFTLSNHASAYIEAQQRSVNDYETVLLHFITNSLVKSNVNSSYRQSLQLFKVQLECNTTSCLYTNIFIFTGNILWWSQLRINKRIIQEDHRTCFRALCSLKFIFCTANKFLVFKILGILCWVFGFWASLKMQGIHATVDLLARSPKVRVGETDAPVTIDGYNGTIARASILWGYEEISLPFLNREDSVLALLNIAFENWSVNNDKPKIVTKCTTSGSGKTRLLLEWPVRAFASPSVLKEFIGDGTDVKTKEQFVNDLWATIHQQRVIVFQCCDVPDDVDNEGLVAWRLITEWSIFIALDLLRHIIVECINSRFRDCTFKYDNKSTTVEDLPEPQSAAEAVKMFNQIIDENYSRPEQFYNATSYNFKPFLLFLGDQIQAWKHQRVNNLLSQIAQLRQQLDTPCTAYVVRKILFDAPGIMFNADWPLYQAASSTGTLQDRRRTNGWFTWVAVSQWHVHGRFQVQVASQCVVGPELLNV